MIDNVKNWSYPFAGASGNPLANLTGLAKARGGFYPMGANGLWHGGVHFDQGTAGAFDQSSVRCIADGEVIAYRIDDKYPLSRYTNEIPLIKQAPFSTGFVLVKHRLALPPLSPAASTAEPPTLTFYSLYMHLQDWAGYQAKPDLPRPAFWGEGIYSVETQGSDLNVRAEANSRAAILATLPKGTTVKIGSEGGDFRKLQKIVSGTAVPALTPTDNEGTLPGYLASKFLKAQSEPKAKGSVVVLDSPVPIKAGDLIGHLGRYQNHNEGTPQPLLHLEVFSCEDVPAFIARSRAHAARLPEAQKTLLKVHKGASKLIPHREGIDANNPPRISDEGVTVGVDLILPQSLLDSLPADAKLLVPASTGGMSCSPETRWWRLDNLLADKDGNPISGWLAEQEMITTRHSPWEWEGYDFIEDGERPAGALAYHLEALRRLIESERASYQSMIDLSDKGPVKQRLYAILDGNGDQKITPEEIRSALGKPWHAQSISQLITKHESEWFWDPGKWDELDELMEHSPADPNPDWAEEKKRIETLSWWKELGGKHGIDPSGEGWHFQPIALLGNLITSIKKWRLGKTSEQYESGGRGPGVISTGRGDHGGASYGVYQMSSRMGVVQEFIETSSYKSDFEGLSPATKEFNEKWRSIAELNPEGFRRAQHDFIKNTHYNTQIKLLKANNFPTNHARAAIHDMIWSSSVQFGPSTRIIIRALDGQNIAQLSDIEIITKVQDYKIDKNEILFASSPTLWPGLLERAENEKSKLIELASKNVEIKEH